MSENKTFLRKAFESAVITAISIFVAAIVGSSVGVMWTKAMNQDKAIKEATSELIITQEVFGEEMERQKSQSLLITEALKQISQRLRNLEEHRGIAAHEGVSQLELEKFSTEQMSRPPVQEILKSYSK